MNGGGWFKINREMFESDIWADVTTFRLFILLIGKASHEDGYRHRGMILNKGQWVRSYRKLADDLSYKEGRGFKKYSLNTIKRCVQKLVESERIVTEETELGTLFTVVNYQDYQNDSKHFNALNRLESENEGRTEVRTTTKEGNSSSSKGFNGVVTESKNAINEELRTNGERSENEVRTLGEQDQELK